ncbi:sulfur carrier protein ThiS [Evansella cellulosilytica]|uniref:Thiamine biosynthesis protein ThiS n=1 Tax=Evansella cellulosilytica (strain ATCC 21833 / DSM 2522 / FERM P-1141 / JCM 9156 / N-4) TaxID=649639 RepID=E6U040_EVAC2|nr:sulfur carrier protein ThiS [Evansella cellulosilytica]ADU29044.1 thiamine biosynthesis protein ThiS [Evansella cellulosilytica DSM 2522]
MVVQVNGKSNELPENMTIAQLLTHFELDKKVVIVELNEMIIDKDHHANTTIKDGDKLELVQFVGGG